jgi:hypothetical protein
VIEHNYIDPDDTLSKDTRDMYSENYLNTISDLTKQILNPHSHIIKRLHTLRNALTLENPEPIYDIQTVQMAIDALQKPR